MKVKVRLADSSIHSFNTIEITDFFGFRKRIYVLLPDATEKYYVWQNTKTLETVKAETKLDKFLNRAFTREVKKLNPVETHFPLIVITCEEDTK